MNKIYTAILLTSFLLCGCGGGGGGGAVAPTITGHNYVGSQEQISYSDGSTVTRTATNASNPTVSWASDHITKSTTYTFSDGTTNVVVAVVAGILGSPSYLGSVETVVTTYGDGTTSTATYNATSAPVSWASDHITKTTTYTFADGTTNPVQSVVAGVVGSPTYNAGVETKVTTYGDGTTSTATYNATNIANPIVTFSNNNQAYTSTYQFADNTSYTTTVSPTPGSSMGVSLSTNSVNFASLQEINAGSLTSSVYDSVKLRAFGTTNFPRAGNYAISTEVINSTNGSTYTFNSSNSDIGLFLDPTFGTFYGHQIWYMETHSLTAGAPSKDYLSPVASEYGWYYQNFGLLNDYVGGYGNASSTGSLTAQIPTTGTATYTGTSIGYYVHSNTSNLVIGDLTAIANFASPSISLSMRGFYSLAMPSGYTRSYIGSSSYFISNSIPTTIAYNDPNLTISGTLTPQASPSSNIFKGVVSNNSGNTPSLIMSGFATASFYGPNADEIGGVFNISDGGSNGYSGAFGGKNLVQITDVLSQAVNFSSGSAQSIPSADITGTSVATTNQSDSLISVKFYDSNGILKGSFNGAAGAGVNDIGGGGLITDSISTTVTHYLNYKQNSDNFLVSYQGAYDSSSPGFSSANYYLSYGVWGDVLGTQLVGGISGRPTDAINIPTTGSATYVGNSLGIYTNSGSQNLVISNLSAGVDFSGRTVSFSTTNSQITPWSTTIASSNGGLGLNGVALTPMSSLNLTGTLTYGSNVNLISGNVSTASGMTGPATAKFYGPIADELGGVFAVKNASGTSSYVGSFGGRR